MASKRKGERSEIDSVKEIDCKKNKTMQSEEAVEIFKYSEDAKPPYTVYIWDISENGCNNLGNLHIQKVGIKFKEYVGKLVLIKKVSKDKIALTFRKLEDANELIENIKKVNPDWRAGIPLFRIYTVGVLLGVDPDLTDKEVEEGLEVYSEKIGEDKVAPCKAVRIKTRKEDDNTMCNSSAVKVYFRSEELPKVATMWFSKITLKPYVPSIRQCYKCFRLGHVKANCNNNREMICRKCGKEHDQASCENALRCINCKGPHDSLYKNCVARIQEVEINKIRVYKSISYKEASKLVVNSTRGHEFINSTERLSSSTGFEERDEYEIMDQTLQDDNNFLTLDEVNSKQKIVNLIRDTTNEKVSQITQSFIANLNDHIQDKDLVQSIISDTELTYLSQQHE